MTGITWVLTRMTWLKNKISAATVVKSGRALRSERGKEFPSAPKATFMKDSSSTEDSTVREE